MLQELVLIIMDWEWIKREANRIVTQICFIVIGLLQGKKMTWKAI